MWQRRNVDSVSLQRYKKYIEKYIERYTEKIVDIINTIKKIFSPSHKKSDPRGVAFLWFCFLRFLFIDRLDAGRNILDDIHREGFWEVV